MAVKRKVALLSNVTVDLIVWKLKQKYDFYQPEGFDTWVQDVINADSNLYSCSADAYVVLLDGREARSWKDNDYGTKRINIWKDAIVSLTKKVTSAPIFVSTLVISENRIKSLSEARMRYFLENSWYQFVQETIDKSNNVFLIDIADLIVEEGSQHFYSNKMWYMSNMPYSRDGLNAVTLELDRVLCSAFEPRKKIIALDLDNTLWGGVVGEDGIEGLVLSNHKEGQRYYDFQRQLLEMKKRGTVLALNSKNNEADAEEIIRNHPYMLLRDDDFVSKKINWNDKATNLKDMSHELNLTEGSFIFLDDNPAEREIVKGKCSDVLVPAFPDDSTELLGFAEEIWFDYCRPLRVLVEDTNKTQMYRNEIQRKNDLRSSLNIDDFLKRLDIVIDIHKMRQNERERVIQLINKTNQFNVTTKRYSSSDLDDIEKNPSNTILAIHSSDKYDDNGLISVVIINKRDDTAFIDSFLMSCRVMGRRIEDAITNEILAVLKCKVIAEYIPTAKNVPVRNLYERLGFSLMSEHSGKKIYEIDATDYQRKDFDCF